MQYRIGPNGQQNPQEISLLGYGCMRFARKGARIDQAKAEREMALALERGVNYFDTAYIYPGSEEAVGIFAAKDGNRDRMLIATKMPHYMCKSITDFDRMFDEQLKRLRTDYIDYYLMHMLTSLDGWERCVAMGVPEWIERKKATGQIRRIGFSYHGGREEFRKICDAYLWEFTQIQLNYLDAGSQAGMDGLLYAADQKGLPVIIMEPLRGGKLAGELPAGAGKVFQAANEKRQEPLSNVGWALQWLFNLPQVTCVLSGMNDVAQVEENCALASAVEADSLTMGELAVYDLAIEEIRKVEKVPCTGCGYCLPCPKKIDIPTCFRYYNLRYTEGWMPAISGYLQSTALTRNPVSVGDCINCGKCAKHCPQHIDVPSEIANASKVLEGVPYKVARRLTRIVWKA